MKNCLIFIFLTIMSFDSFAGAGTFPQGDHIKALKNSVEFKNGHELLNGASFNQMWGFSVDAPTGTGSHNVGIGAGVLSNLSDGAGNIGIGGSAGSQIFTGSNNVMVGLDAMRGFGSMTGDKNIAIGNQSMYEAIGAMSSNIAIGYQAGYSLSVGSGENIFIGDTAGHEDANGTRSVAIGADAGYWGNNSRNTYIGWNAGKGVSANNNNSNTFIGYSVGANVSTGARNVLLGYEVNLPSGATNDYMSLGNTIYADLTTDFVGIGKIVPTVALDVTGVINVASTTESSIPCPVMTTVQRDLITPATGSCIYNSTTSDKEFWDGSAWLGSPTPAGLPVMAKGSILTSDGVGNGEFTACADTEILEWDSVETSGVKCVAKPTSPVVVVPHTVISAGSGGAAGGKTLTAPAITTTGRPVLLVMQANATAGGGYSGTVIIRRSGTIIANYGSINNTNSSVTHIDTPGAGTYTYSIQVGTYVFFQNLIVAEM